MSRTLKFDLVTVFEGNVLEALARQTGWVNDTDKNSIEFWNMWVAEREVCVMLLLERDLDVNKFLVKGIPCSVKDGYMNFCIPLVMCKSEFLNILMNMCGYNEDRYNSESVVKYLLENQMKLRGDEYSRIYLSIPLWEYENN